jgi:hypothetical protein
MRHKEKMPTQATKATRTTLLQNARRGGITRRQAQTRNCRTPSLRPPRCATRSRRHLHHPHRCWRNPCAQMPCSRPKDDPYSRLRQQGLWDHATCRFANHRQQQNEKLLVSTAKQACFGFRDHCRQGVSVLRIVQTQSIFNL